MKQTKADIATVTVANLDISFFNMVGLFVKAAFAMIPAIIIVSLATSFIMATLVGTGLIPIP